MRKIDAQRIARDVFKKRMGFAPQRLSDINIICIYDNKHFEVMVGGYEYIIYDDFIHKYDEYTGQLLLAMR